MGYKTLMRINFRLKLLGSQPMTPKSVSTIIGRAADVCTYIGRSKDQEIQVLVRGIQPGSLEILYILASAAQNGNALAQLALDLIAVNIVAAFGVMRLATDSEGRPRPLPGPAASAMADILDAVEEDPAIEGWSARKGRSAPVRRTRRELHELRGTLGGPKSVTVQPKVHVEIQQQFPGFPRPSWQIKWQDGEGWQSARVEAPINGDLDVNRYDKLVVDLEIHKLTNEGAEPATEVFIRNVHWAESNALNR